ncbi:MAG: SLC13 family permease [Desulfomonile tiedjei]|nr:SLC13 family permease [Desulfomonile tiedjei]
MGFEAWYTITVVAVMLGFLSLTDIGPDTVLMGGVTLLLITGILTPQDALAGLANEGMVTVGVLYIVAEGLRQTGVTQIIVERLLGPTASTLRAQLKMMIPAAVISNFTNNTPQVAIMIPAVKDWARRYDLRVSDLMMPLSYATIVGGMCTIIGTAPNLIVNGLITHQAKMEPFSFFAPAWVGIPIGIIGIAFIIPLMKLVPDRHPASSEFESAREYTVEMIVEPDSSLVGKTLEEAGLGHFAGAYVAEIDRKGHVIAAVASDEPLEAEDRLVFVGGGEAVAELQKIKGLKPATDQVFRLDVPRSERLLIEAVVSPGCPIVGRSVRQGRFRSRYDAVVMAVARHGQRLQQNVANIILRPGDVLLLEAHESFIEQQRNSRDFYLVSPIEDSSPPRHERAWVSLAILGLMVVLASLEWLSMVKAAMLAAGLMIMTGCVSGTEARRSIDTGVLLTIAAALGLGAAMLKTGAAEGIASSVTALAGSNAWMNLAAIYLLTLVLTEIISHAAAAVLVFPIAMTTAQTLGVSVTPFAMAVMMAASVAFATPFGYQTNMMVYGPGGYHFSDFLRVGIPMDIITATTAILIIPLVWPF